MAENPYESPKESASAGPVPPMPASAIVAVVCAGLSVVLISVLVFCDYFLRYGTLAPFYLVFGVVLLLVFVGALTRQRFILRWSRLSTAFFAAGSTFLANEFLFLALYSRPPDAPRLDVLIGLFSTILLATVQWTLLVCLNLQSARVYFGLACRHCGEEGSWLADWHGGQPKCDKCRCEG